MSRFYIGQKVIAIDSNEDLGFVKGKIYVIQSLRMRKCSCNLVEADLGLKRINYYDKTTCMYCDDEIEKNGVYLTERMFIPLSEKTAESESFSETLIKELEIEINEENSILK